jgi:hypothetical protein
VLFHALRRLAGLMIAFALISAVATNGGPGLAARSMTGYLSAFDAAEAGDHAQADRISGDLARQWDHLRLQVQQVLHRAETVVSDLVPR